MQAAEGAPAMRISTITILESLLKSTKHFVMGILLWISVQLLLPFSPNQFSQIFSTLCMTTITISLFFFFSKRFLLSSLRLEFGSSYLIHLILYILRWRFLILFIGWLLQTMFRSPQFFSFYVSLFVYPQTGHSIFNTLSPHYFISSSIIFLLYYVTDFRMPLDSAWRTWFTSSNFCLTYSETFMKRYYHWRGKWKSSDLKCLIFSVKQLW